MTSDSVVRAALRAVRVVVCLAALSPLLPPAARADEGMWTFDNFPAQAVGEKYGFTPDAAWLEHVRLSSVRLAGGCSGSFVSPDGLVMTNHHCAHECIEQLSTGDRDYVASGFLAKGGADEVRCPEIELNQLLSIEDVTARVEAAAQGTSGDAAGKARREAMSAIEKACGTSPGLRCEVVTLYQGGQYHLYRYRRFQDVRLVFAPEFAIAFFGGDPDNFTFPRYDLDVTFLRAYEDGRPAKVDHWFRWSPAGAQEGDLTFVSGNPGSTSRLQTLAQLAFDRDVVQYDAIVFAAERKGMLRAFAARGPEQERISKAELFYVENGYKARRGQLETLKDPAFAARKAADEKALRERIAADPKLAAYRGAFEAIERAVAAHRALYPTHLYLEKARAFQSTLFTHARDLVRAADERPRPNEKRLREYTDAKLPGLEQALFSEAPIHDEFEIAKLTFSLRRFREDLGPDHPAVRRLLGPKSPEELAQELVQGTRLEDVGLRRQLYAGGRAAVDAAVPGDAMLAFARAVDEGARAVRKEYEDAVESVEDEAGGKIARALFDLYGTSRYPDATFSPRLSFGSVEGYVSNGTRVAPVTQMGGAFGRHTGRDPFRLPQTWLDARPTLDLSTPLNVATSNDIIGGNSGSPVIDREARIVGLVFDGNIESLGGDFWFDRAVNRCVSVHSRALLLALSKIYGADRLVKELTATR